MATTMTARERGYESDYPVDEAARGSGWVAFAAIMLGFAGAWNIIDGILAVSRSKVYAPNATYVFSDVRTWGWIILVVGIAEVCASFAVLSGNQLARWVGIGVAGISAIGNLLFAPGQPFWALAMFTVDLLVIYGLAVYGGREETA
jgi:hypothetical protein